MSNIGAICGGGFLLLANRGRRDYLNLCRADDTMTVLERKRYERRAAWLARVKRHARRQKVYRSARYVTRLSARAFWGLEMPHG